MIPDFDLNAPGVFLGFHMSQNRRAIPAWSYLLEKAGPVSTIVEIGTNIGGFSCLLALGALKIGATFDTLDVCEFNEETRPLFEFLCARKGGFHQLDVFSNEGQSLVKSRLSREGRALLLCDGGNKGKEFSTFAPFLKDGDIIGVHDARGRESWPWQEFHPNMFRDFAVEHRLWPFMDEIFLETGWFVCCKLPQGAEGVRDESPWA